MRTQSWGMQPVVEFNNVLLFARTFYLRSSKKQQTRKRNCEMLRSRLQLRSRLRFAINILCGKRNKGFKARDFTTYHCAQLLHQLVSISDLLYLVWKQWFMLWSHVHSPQYYHTEETTSEVIAWYFMNLKSCEHLIQLLVKWMWCKHPVYCFFFKDKIIQLISFQKILIGYLDVPRLC